MLRIKKSEFVTSVGKNGGYPSEGGAEIAIVGKSNVGKSSIINSLCNMNKLAKTSQKPGKTRLINYFRINGDFYIVDLPALHRRQSRSRHNGANLSKATLPPEG